MNLDNLKNQYNDLIVRNKKAEIFFKTKSAEECIKYLGLFNEVTIKLSTLRNDIEALLKREMTKEERLEGFKEVGDFCN